MNKKNKIIYISIAFLTILSCLFFVGIIDNNRKLNALDSTAIDSSDTESQPNTRAEEGTATEGETETRAGSTNESSTEPTSTSQVTVDETTGTGKSVYLTFDDGPSPVTDRVLDILDKYDIKATFFVVYSKKYSSKLLDIHNRGHAIGLHTYSHKYEEVYASTDAFFNDLEKISDHVEQVVGIKPMISRFPGGSSNQVSKRISPGIMTKLSSMVKDKGYTYFDWNCENGDGNGSNIAPEKLLAQVKATTPTSAKNVCVLMHDSSEKNTTADALPKIIEYFLAGGYEFKVLTENTTPIRHAISN